MARTLGVGVMVSALVLSASASPAVERRAEELPNLVPLPAFDLTIDTDEEGVPVLAFAVATANRGNFALDLQFEAEGVSTQTSAANQCTEWATDRVCLTREHVGSFEWHPDHGHHHFQDFALYELRRFRKPGVPDMRPRGLVATSGKVSFCLIDVEQDREADNVIYSQPHPLYYTCVAGAGFQGISPGWRDVYARGTPGQWFPLEAIADGDYALVVTSDPAERLFETNETDNRAVSGFRLYNHGTGIEALCASDPGSLRCQPLL